MTPRLRCLLPWAFLAGVLVVFLSCARTVPEPLTPVAPQPAEAVREEAARSVDRRTEPSPPLPPTSLPAPGPTAGPLAGLEAPLTLRVGLASDLDRLALPCCEAGWRIAGGGERLALDRSLEVRPAADASAPPVFRLQVAALRDEGQAAELAGDLAQRIGAPADHAFDANTGLYRVRLGRFAERAEADGARRRWAARADLTGAWVVSEGGVLRQPALRVTAGNEDRLRVPGRWLVIEPSEEAAGSAGIAFDGGRYRGRLAVYLNDRGSLNVVNELELEDYLRGVVPGEMGPELYNRLEALKAQTVAARTYALRNLGEFEREGYDICSTPRCQVYRGMTVEHPLSDRAIAETAGQVLISDGDLVDARYSSTCGGHTEDVDKVFPLESYRYLRGVPCVEAGGRELNGALPSGQVYPDALSRQLIAAPAGSRALERRLEALARQAKIAIPRARLDSLQRAEVRRFVLALLDLLLDPRTEMALPDLVARPPAEWSAVERRRAAALLASGLWNGEDGESLSPSEVETVVWSVARVTGLVEIVSGIHHTLEGRRWTVRTATGESVLELPRDVATFRRRGSELRSGGVSLWPGDPVQWVRFGGRPVAVLQAVDGRTFRLPANRWRSWTRFRSDHRLAKRVEERYPGLGFSGFEVLETGVSGRVSRLRLRGTENRQEEVTGLAVRWTLDLPDTLFTVRRTRSRNGEPGYLFSGGGLGHGVGMCQNGAFAMALRDLTYRQILDHYYTGVSLAKARGRRSSPLRDSAPAR
ncbi:MAG: SpoIID/LytB domain-containing protein [Acidobacteriota bacterium]